MKLFAFLKKHPILVHFVSMLLLVLGLLVGLFFWLDTYTRHGETYEVPDVRGTTVEVAAVMLAEKGMQCAVVDSVFRPTAQPGLVLEQTPSAGSQVKGGRRIYLIVNAKMAQMIPFPDVVDMSLRQAKVQVEGSDFVIKEIKYEPSEYRDLVLSVEYEGQEVYAAQLLPFRSEVILHVGEGLYVPAVDTLAVDSLAVEVASDADADMSFGEESLFEL